MGYNQNRAANRVMRREKKVRNDESLIRAAKDEAVRNSSKRRVRAADRVVKPRTKAQALYDRAISANIITFSVGPWGTGKTWWAAMRAAKALDAGEIERVIITRPAVVAEEDLGFLPGELPEKYEPYFRPVREALVEFLGAGSLEYHIKNGTIEARPLAYLRGATFENAYVLLDEAQNTTPNQMKLFLSRIGENCKVVIDGDLEQKDIPGKSGLEDAIARLDGMAQVGIVRFDGSDIVRSGICKEIWDRYRS